MKRVLLAAAVLFVCGLMYLYGKATEGDKMQRDIAEQVIRLHVVANSDSAEDQKLKLEVKEEVVRMLRDELVQDTSVISAQQTLRDHLREVEQTR